MADILERRGGVNRRNVLANDSFRIGRALAESNCLGRTVARSGDNASIGVLGRTVGMLSPLIGATQQTGHERRLSSLITPLASISLSGESRLILPRNTESAIGRAPSLLGANRRPSVGVVALNVSERKQARTVPEHRFEMLRMSSNELMTDVAATEPSRLRIHHLVELMTQIGRGKGSDAVRLFVHEVGIEPVEATLRLLAFDQFLALLLSGQAAEELSDRSPLAEDRDQKRGRMQVANESRVKKSDSARIRLELDKLYAPSGAKRITEEWRCWMLAQGTTSRKNLNKVIRNYEPPRTATTFER
ncbi:hypothetical protein M0D69_01465 [Caballeronia sp. SEWSISQ10-4 2]|uniref:hypothetical protein n=1 Tax=Caballeronia sp. SEWSISQ10-4 2 TaxID=2937438 RepID=UPI00264B0B8A|nr:hypothetical protein [Caballeronia sp. SEWSISQ10-4 2]MDN7176708.1 hypothetical protein [Caballeronia sp. SEWSISQ10-4 2]